ASCSSTSAAVEASSCSANTLATYFSLSSSSSPSLHISSRSWLPADSSQKSAMVSGPESTARVITCRCRESCACSGRSTPASSISCTTEWSTLTWVSPPPENRYTRESPTLNTSQ